MKDFNIAIEALSQYVRDLSAENTVLKDKVQQLESSVRQRALVGAVNSEPSNDPVEQLLRFTQHRPDCTWYECSFCHLSESNGHHEDSYNGDTSWHNFVRSECKCGLVNAAKAFRPLLGLCPKHGNVVMGIGGRSSWGYLIRAMLRREVQLRALIKCHAKHPSSCPKGVGAGYYVPPADAVCSCGIDEAINP